jgi:hypothetical protein
MGRSLNRYISGFFSKLLENVSRKTTMTSIMAMIERDYIHTVCKYDVGTTK